mmetsp:Transcript_18979/g.22672  ORF Transcript_18979/g.22672 Transcript_18979/m.22672 type:complete len:193 (-) Transcript_18979:287-865(-)
MSGGKDIVIDFGAITDDNVEQLRLVNKACFPINYNPTFYSEVVKRKDEDLCKFAYHNGFVCGEICARVEPLPAPTENNAADAATATAAAANPRKRIYIMTLGVLAAYRGRRIGTKLVQSILDHYEAEKTGKFAAVEEIVLHVQTSNEGAMKFYIDGFGFEKGEMVENYYKRIDPPHCFILRKKMTHADSVSV